MSEPKPNIFSSRTDKAMAKGRAAACASRPFSDNPYTFATSIQSANHRAWALGWKNWHSHSEPAS